MRLLRLTLRLTPILILKIFYWTCRLKTVRKSWFYFSLHIKGLFRLKNRSVVNWLCKENEYTYCTYSGKDFNNESVQHTLKCFNSISKLKIFYWLFTYLFSALWISLVDEFICLLSGFYVKVIILTILSNELSIWIILKVLICILHGSQCSVVKQFLAENDLYNPFLKVISNIL